MPPSNTSDANFTTEDYGLANWLVFNRVVLLGAVAYPNSPKKKFVFMDSQRLADLVKEWGLPTAMPSTEPAKTCKRFFIAHTVIKRALKDSLDVTDY